METSHVQQAIGRDLALPEQFLEAASISARHSVYVVLCETSELVYLDDSFEAITGYSKEDMRAGLEFWMSLIHPEDKPKVMDDIIEAHKHVQVTPALYIPELFLNLEYRLRTKSGEWLWIRELKFITVVHSTIDKVLGLICDITKEKLTEESDFTVKTFSGKLLPLAMQFKQQTRKTWISKPNYDNVSAVKTEGIALLTNREKEVLQLVGQGFSSKQISDKLYISINTVETHRRHLLEKLQVKNSMELIKEASKVFWF